ncbi:MAG: hypothetical protein JJU36_15135, partial [Phycisphaeraceae bacterium]|nr:hypothetical protein [Phycisphaeraceae bacterium]
LLPDGVSVFEAIGIEDMVADASREVFSRLLPDLLEHKPVGSSRLSLMLAEEGMASLGAMVVGWESKAAQECEGADADYITQQWVHSVEAIRQYRISRDKNAGVEKALTTGGERDYAEVLEHYRQNASPLRMPIVQS